MIAVSLLLQAAAVPAPLPVVTVPSAEAARLGAEVARSGTFGRLVPLMIERETEELVRETVGLTLAEQAELRVLAMTTGRAAIDSIVGRMGVAYATALTPADMRAIIAFNRTDAAVRYRAAEPNAMAVAIQSMGKLDFKGSVLKAFCARTGKGCTAGK